MALKDKPSSGYSVAVFCSQCVRMQAVDSQLAARYYTQAGTESREVIAA